MGDQTKRFAAKVGRFIQRNWKNWVETWAMVIVGLIIWNQVKPDGFVYRVIVLIAVGAGVGFCFGFARSMVRAVRAERKDDR